MFKRGAWWGMTQGVGTKEGVWERVHVGEMKQQEKNVRRSCGGMSMSGGNVSAGEREEMHGKGNLSVGRAFGQ